MLTISSKAPEFTLPDQDGKSQSLSDYRGQAVVVYFYPEDDTAGCTKEACTIRDAYGEFEKHNVKVFGISADTVESHKKFVEKYQLPFTLLSDPDAKVIDAYEAREGARAKRVSYLIGSDGLITHVYPDVDPAHHAGQLLGDISSI